MFQRLLTTTTSLISALPRSKDRKLTTNFGSSLFIEDRLLLLLLLNSELINIIAAVTQRKQIKVGPKWGRGGLERGIATPKRGGRRDPFNIR